MKRTLIVITLLYNFFIISGQIPNISTNIEDSVLISKKGSAFKCYIINIKNEDEIRPNSIFYLDHLLYLTEGDKFLVYWLKNLLRDQKLESELNCKKLKRSFLISDTLFAVDTLNLVHFFDPNQKEWVQYSSTLPFFNKAPVFENMKYICYSTCNGEFGGTLFFLNKETRKITFVPSTCTNTVLEFQGDYYVISSLPHLSGSGSIKRISNPDSLYTLPDNLYSTNILDHPFLLHDLIKKASKHNAVKYDGLFSKIGVMTTSAFMIDSNFYYLTCSFSDEHFGTFLTTIENGTITYIENPNQVFRALPFHNILTRNYNNLTIIDCTESKSISSNTVATKDNALILSHTFLITDRFLVKINWLK